MRSIAFVAGVVRASGVGAALARSGVRSGDNLEWKPAPPDLPRGAEVSALFGDLRASGPFMLRVLAPNG